MGAPETGIHAAEQATAETLLTAFRTIKPAQRARHEGVLAYWLSIRGEKEFPPLHDLDPLEISDAGPSSILLELIGGGQDAEIRHLGDDLKEEIAVQRIIDAPNPSLLSCISKKLPIVAISRDFLAFEDSFDLAGGWTRCWVTLLPLSSCGSWVDYVYAFVTVEKGGGKAVKPVKSAEPAETPADVVAQEAEAIEEPVTAEKDPVDELEMATEEVSTPVEEPATEEAVEHEETESVDEPEQEQEPARNVQPEPVAEIEASLEPEPAAEEPAETSPAKSAPGFSKLLEGFANLAGFYGQGVKVEDPVVNAELPASDPAPDELQPSGSDVVDSPGDEPAAEAQEFSEVSGPPADESAGEVEPEPAPEPAPACAPALEGSLQSKLTEVRAKADEARQARLRAVAALHEGLSAAYDFALDAETSPEEYLRLVEAQGMKIQLRAPMAPIAKLAFDGLVDAGTIAEFEAVLAWALKTELPRGALIKRIDQAGGVPELLSEVSKAA